MIVSFFSVARMSTQKVVTSAVVVVPPQSLWPQIQEIRKVHDKAFGRWPPHINLYVQLWILIVLFNNTAANACIGYTLLFQYQTSLKLLIS